MSIVNCQFENSYLLTTHSSLLTTSNSPCKLLLFSVLNLKIPPPKNSGEGFCPKLLNSLLQIYKKNFLDIAKSEIFLLYSIIWKTIAPFESLIPLYIIYRYGQSEKKSSTFCRFFARTVLFFIKLFYLCTDFMALNAL